MIVGGHILEGGASNGGDVTLRGTSDNESEQSGSEFRFASANDSKVVVTVKDGTPPTIEIGVYYV